MGNVRARNGMQIAEANLGNGKRKSKSFPTKRAAWAWIEKIESEDGESLPDKTFADLLDRYGENVSIYKKSHKRELNRIGVIKRDPLGKVKLADLDAPAISDWRDRRLKDTSAATVLRDWNLLNHACNLAVNEWHWLKLNPMKTVKRPGPPPPRSRVISEDEIKAILYTCGTGTTTAQVGVVMLFALETAMRAGEICGLTWEHVHARHVHIPESKNGEQRDVPLSRKARELLEQQSKEDPVFSITTSQLDALWRKCRDRVMIEDLHFHDTRRTALTKLAKKMPVLDLARISGHKDLRILMNVYYQPSIDDLADKMD